MAVIITLYAGLCTPGDESNLRPDRNRAALLELLHCHHPDGFTVFDGIGCWQGNEEPGVSVVFIGQRAEADALEDRVRALAMAYKLAAQQDEVWITRRDETLIVV